MEQLVKELEQEELQSIYGGEIKCIFLNGQWVVVEVGTQKSN